jgi:hypothetical protein
MSCTVQEVQDEARALLNDVSGAIATDAALLPYTKKAYRELIQEYVSHGLSEAKEVSAVVSVPASAGGAMPSQPTDIIYPVALFERAAGSQLLSDFVPMEKVDWEPLEDPTTTIQKWTWREETIILRGCTADREVLVRYKKLLTTIANVATVLPVGDGLTFLAARTAAIFWAIARSNMQKAKICQDDANWHLGVLLNKGGLEAQDTPIRRKPYRAGRS